MAPRKGHPKKDKNKNKAEGKEPPDPYIAQEPPWEAALAECNINNESWSCRVYMVCAADAQYLELVDFIGTTIYTGCRRGFILIDYLDVAEMLSYRKGLDGALGGSSKRSGGSSKTSRGHHGAETHGYGPMEEMFRTAATMFQTTGMVSAGLMACLLKQEIAEFKRERTTIIEIELPGTVSNHPESKQPKKDLANSKPDSKPVDSKQAEDRRRAKQSAVDVRKESRHSPSRRKTVKVDEEQKTDPNKQEEEDNFCSKNRRTALLKRGEFDELSIHLDEVIIKDDEPVEGPDMYVILTGFHQPDLPIEMEKRGIPVEVLFRIGTKPGAPRDAAPFKTGFFSAADAPSRLSLGTITEGSVHEMTSHEIAEQLNQSQKILAFWEQLVTDMKKGDDNLVPRNFIVSELQFPLRTIHCSKDKLQAGMFMFDLLAEHIYDHLKMRLIFDCYISSLKLVAVPDISSVFPPIEPAPAESEDSSEKASERPPSADAVNGAAVEPSPSKVPQLTPDPVLYNERLDSVPPEAVTVPMLVCALVDQVACWLNVEEEVPSKTEPEDHITTFADLEVVAENEQEANRSLRASAEKPDSESPPSPSATTNATAASPDDKAKAESNRASLDLGAPVHAKNRRKSSAVPGNMRASHVKISESHQPSPVLPALKETVTSLSPGSSSPRRRGSRRVSAIPEPNPSSVALHGVARPERREAIQKDRSDSMGLQLPPLSEGLLHGSEVLEQKMRDESSSKALDHDWPVMRAQRLRRHFARKDPLTEAAPVLVYHRDLVNTQFYSRTDRSVVHQLETVMRQNYQELQLAAMPAPPDGSFLKHHAAKQELLSQLQAVVSSDDNMEYLVRLLMFESLYPALTSELASPRAQPYPHVSLPAPHVPVDMQLITPECGHGASCDELRQLSTCEETSDVVSRFSDHCWSEQLDPLSMALTIQELESKYSLLAARHFKGDDGLYMVYGHPRVFGGHQEDRWRYRLHTTVGFRDFMEHVREIPAVGRWFEEQKDRLITGEKLGREETMRREEIRRLQPIPDPPKMKEELSDDVFIAAGSVKSQFQVPPGKRPPRAEQDKLAAISEKTAPKLDNVKTEKAKEKGDGKERKAGKSKKEDKKDKDSSKKKRMATLEIEMHAIQDPAKKSSPTSATIHTQSHLLAPQPPDIQFCGFDMSGHLVHLSGRCSRQYFDNGSYVTIKSSEYVRGTRTMAASVTHGETSLQVNPTAHGEDVVVHLLGGSVLHLCPKVVKPPVERPPAPEPGPAGSSGGRTNSSTPRHRSPSGSGRDKTNKKENMKKKGSIDRRSSRRNLSTKGPSSRGSPLSSFPEPEPDLQPPAPPSVPSVPVPVQMLRISCPSGLVVELEPDPFLRGAAPHMMVRQYYLDADCGRSRVRLFVSEGTVVRMEDGEDGEDGGVQLLGADGSIVRCACVKEQLPDPVGGADTSGTGNTPHSPQPEERRGLDKLGGHNSERLGTHNSEKTGAHNSEKMGAHKSEKLGGKRSERLHKSDKQEPSPPAPTSPTSGPPAAAAAEPEFEYRLQPLSQVLANGELRELDAPAGQKTPSSYLTKMATDPITKELYVIRQDGVTAVLRPGGQSVIQHADGTRLTLTMPAPEKDFSQEQVPVCSDYIVNDAGWIVGERVSWLMGMRVLISDAVTNDWDIQAEHPDYCRVLMRQLHRTCQVHLPQGTVIEATSEGSYTVRQSDGTSLLINLDMASLSIPPTDGTLHPTVHTFPLTRPKMEPPKPPSPEVPPDASVQGAAGADGGDGAIADGIRIPEVVVDPPTVENLARPDQDEQQNDTLCETIDSQRRVFRVNRRGRLMKVGDRDTCPASGLTLAMRSQMERGTVLPQRPRLLVLFREGDGVELLPSSEVSQYLSFVRTSPGGQVWRDVHLSDPEVSTVRVFRPVTPSEMPEQRWKMPYLEETLVPPNLRSRELSVMCATTSKDPATVRATRWGFGDFHPLHHRHKLPPAKLVHTRELVHMPRVEEQMYRELVKTVHQTRLRNELTHSSEEPVLLEGSHPPQRRNVHLFEANRLIEWLESAKANEKLAMGGMPTPPHWRPEHWELCKAESDKIRTYTHMLRTKKFPTYFLSEAGLEFLGKVRQTERPLLAPRWRHSVSEDQVRLAAAPRPLPPGTVYCRPPTLDLGAVRRGSVTTGSLNLVNSGDVQLEFRLRPPAPLMGLRVEPRAGSVPPHRQLQLNVTFRPGETMTGRSVYFRLDVVINGGLDLVQVPLVACVGDQDSMLARVPPFGHIAQSSSVH